MSISELITPFPVPQRRDDCFFSSPHGGRLGRGYKNKIGTISLLEHICNRWYNILSTNCNRPKGARRRQIRTSGDLRKKSRDMYIKSRDRSQTCLYNVISIYIIPKFLFCFMFFNWSKFHSSHALI